MVDTPLHVMCPETRIRQNNHLSILKTIDSVKRFYENLQEKSLGIHDLTDTPPLAFFRPRIFENRAAYI